MSTTSLNNLLAGSGLGTSATAALQLAADTLGPAIQAGLGTVDIDDITTSEVILVTLLIDDSSSIDYAGNAQPVRDGFNGLLAALKGSKQAASVLVGCRTLNGGVVYPYKMLDNADKLDAKNFQPYGNTPLYRETGVTLASVAAKMAEFEQGGVAARGITVIVTDGGDNHGGNVSQLRHIVEGMIQSEQHIVAGVGVDDGYTDFRQVFRDIGIRDEWILTTGASASEIRAAFATVSQSAVRASQTAGSFSQAALGGFGN